MRRVSPITSAAVTRIVVTTALLATVAVAGQSPAGGASAESRPAFAADAKTLVAQGRQRQAAGDVAGAIELFERVVRASPDSTDALVALARAHAAARRVSRAADILTAALERQPLCDVLWLELVQLALDSRQYGLALRRVEAARRRLTPSPARLAYQAALARFHLGQSLGATRVREVAGGRAGQFAGEWLLVERRGDADRFLCCPRQSALYELRRALDAGFDEQAAHCLHARIWASAGRPEVGLGILRSREAAWRKHVSFDTLKTLGDLSLACNQVVDYLRYARSRARRAPNSHDEIMYEAYVAAAQRYNERGDEVMSRELLQRALDLRQDDVALMLRLGDAIWESGDCDQARPWYRRVLTAEPDHPDRMRILERLGD